MSPLHTPPPNADRRTRLRRGRVLAILLVVVAIATFVVTYVLVSIVEHKQEGRTPFVRLVEVDETTTDPDPWGLNWPNQYDGYMRTVDYETPRGGGETLPPEKLDAYPFLRRMYDGYAFALSYREARGHAWMLFDQTETPRVTERDQPGACLHCHASVVPTYRRLGLEAMGEPADAAALAEDFRWDAVMRGFEQVSTAPYREMYEELLLTPDGTPGNEPGEGGAAQLDAADPHALGAHAVSCVDCHHPESMAVRVTRPAFVRGIAKLAEGDAPVPHLPSIERWREGDRDQPYDPNLLASRQEMRSFVCAQCHVEYYCGPKETIFYPWDNGLRVEDIEQTYDEHRFPSGEAFYDYLHGETGAPIYKAQHPEFELWSQGIHARSGVSCSDCHMPYQREGAMKVSSHWVQSPMETLNTSCQGCHNDSEDVLREKVETIQGRTVALLERAGDAVTDMLDAVNAATESGAGSAEDMERLERLQLQAIWRVDFISSENSEGFHADQEAARVLAEAIDYARRAQAMAAVIAGGGSATAAATTAGAGEHDAVTAAGAPTTTAAGTK